MTKAKITKRVQKDRWTSSWSKTDLIKRQLFLLVWLLLCRWTPKKLYVWRNFVLKSFGAEITGKPFVASSAKIYFPWNLSLEDRSCIAERVDVYNLARITLGQRSVVSKSAFLCCGAHDFKSATFELTVAPIFIGSDSFVGARAIILPGCSIGRNCLLGAGAVLNKSVPDKSVAVGNPAKIVSSIE